jgi:hypothetical protein
VQNVRDSFAKKPDFFQCAVKIGMLEYSYLFYCF